MTTMAIVKENRGAHDLRLTLDGVFPLKIVALPFGSDFLPEFLFNLEKTDSGLI